ncbi:MAG TPA: CDP-diacylglycerol--serine O-phosphatidyltransferase [Stellaceae bacterium]|jgi:CDP-diacylglycerol--serine O-phosphatidyltransferase|nr:CDP-diacylglycerol--serine O-phosphatidyltransferase [Stellaceae bacterium]
MRTIREKMRSPRGRVGRRERVRRPRMRVRRIQELSVNRMVPNILTLLALCAGMTAIRFALNGNFQGAVYAIIVAGVLDGLDGRVARLLKATSHFGAELDSLSDFVSFGVAPAAVMYLWTMSALSSLGWAIVLIYAVCSALRLARFNTQLSVEPTPQAARFFTGVPAPGGAGLVLMPLYASFEWGDWIIRSPYIAAVWTALIAFLMVSTLPTLSLKKFSIPHHYVMPLLLGIGLVAAFLTTAPWPTLFLIGFGYIGSIPLTIRAAARARRAAEAKKPELVEAVALPAPPPAVVLGEAAAPPPNEWRH